MSKSFTIQGQILNMKGEGLPGLKVEAWDKDRILKDDFLGFAISNLDGNFSIHFSQKDFIDFLIFDRKPDIYFLIYEHDQLMKSTKDEVIWAWEQTNIQIQIQIDLASPTSTSPPLAHTFEVQRMEVESASSLEGSIPERITFVIPQDEDKEKHHLFVDQVPIPRKAWSYDSHDQILRWKGAHGGGEVHFHRDHVGGYGNIGSSPAHVSVSLTSTKSFLCSVAEGVGIYSTETAGGGTRLVWDPDSQEWQDGRWIEDRLLLSYSYSPGDHITTSGTGYFSFVDQQRGSDPYIAEGSLGSFSTVEYNERNYRELNFQADLIPLEDGGSDYAGPENVYPYLMRARINNFGSRINGAMNVIDIPPAGESIGFQGERSTSDANGYFQVSAKTAPFSHFDGQILIDGQAIAKAYLKGSTLHWKDLGQEHQRQTGLPQSGFLHFAYGGKIGFNTEYRLTVKRLSATEAIKQIAEYQALHPGMHASNLALAHSLDSGTLNSDGLNTMTPFTKNTQGEWKNVVQESVVRDINSIVLAIMEPDLWETLFPHIAQPTLDSRLESVFNTPVSDRSNASTFYKSLAVPVMVQGLSESSNDVSPFFNGPRAIKRINYLMAKSTVYREHSQLLFRQYFKIQNSLINQYLDDQISNASDHTDYINERTAEITADIRAKVTIAHQSDQDLVDELVNQEENNASYAIENNLFWAWALYHYNTSPGKLIHLGVQINNSLGLGDGSNLTRTIQAILATLNILDISGYFANQYLQNINVYLATVIIPSQLAYGDDMMDESLVRQAFQKFVDDAQANLDEDIKTAAQEIDAILNDANSDSIHETMSYMRTVSNALAGTFNLPVMIAEMHKKFRDNFPNYGIQSSKLFCAGFSVVTSSLAVANLINEFKDWDELNTAERLNLVNNTSSLLLQTTAAIVKRGVRYTAVFSATQGLSRAERSLLLGRFILTGDNSLNRVLLEVGLSKIGNSFSRWLGGREMTLDLERNATTVALETGNVAWKDMALVSKLCGRNLNEFMATRLGPVFVVSGMIFSIYSISQGEGEIEMINDALNIAGSSLALFATAGGWLVSAEIGVAVTSTAIFSVFVTAAGVGAVVCAVVGVGLLIYEMSHTPPDPVEEFRNHYAVRYGLTIDRKNLSVDYIQSYMDGGKEMQGFTLMMSDMWPNNTLKCESDHEIIVANNLHLPDTVWMMSTDGYGRSRIVAMTQPDPDKPPTSLLLSLMADNSIIFAPKVVPGDSSNIKSQLWRCAVIPGQNNRLHSGQFVKTLELSLTAMLADNTTFGTVSWNGAGLSLDENYGHDSFRLDMAALAPFYIRPLHVYFTAGFHSDPNLSFSFVYFPTPSRPMTITPQGDFPYFLDLIPDKSSIQGKGYLIDEDLKGITTTYSLLARNELGLQLTSLIVSID